jgi:acetyltransferase (GNAT) family protein
MAGLVVKPIEALSEGQLARVQMIYEGAFSPGLRVPFSELAQPGDADRTFVAMERETTLVGLAALRLLVSVQWSFLRYFAIAAERRNQGLGRQFWQLLQLELQKQAWPTRIIFEVEDPGDSAGDEAERAIRARRISFWTACGARLLEARGYVLPDYTASGTTEPMLLMAATAAAVPSVQGDVLRGLVLAIYTDRYGMAPNDPLVSQALASIALDRR